LSSLKSISQTHDERDVGRRRVATHAPGLLVVFSAGKAVDVPLPLVERELEIGRGTLPVTDPLISRNHARVTFDAGARVWRIEDLGSRNGTFVDGKQVEGVVSGEPRILRTGGTLALLVTDLHPHLAHPIEVAGGHVAGARLRAARKLIERAAAHANLHITGETGSGKELAARHFHQAGPRPNGPFVAVNCAAIPEGVAERLLFGTRKGAFSGAVADADGYVQAADGGTLFLDEIADLDLQVQAKLLRVLEAKQVLPLGASRPIPIDLRVCSATHHDLRTLVSAKRFREDLYYRIARPHVVIPPLRERLEEIPHLVVAGIRAVSAELTPHVGLVETCMLRHWPGNVRELLAEVKEAARVVSTDGRAGASVMAEHLNPNAGIGFAARGPVAAAAASPVPAQAAAGQPVAPLPPREVILDALRKHQGRVATAARALGLRRNQLRRWLKSHDVGGAFVTNDDGDDQD
jgi:transcriptional regulator of acetoin/glycerol metabolism